MTLVQTIAGENISGAVCSWTHFKKCMFNVVVVLNIASLRLSDMDQSLRSAVVFWSYGFLKRLLILQLSLRKRWCNWLMSLSSRSLYANHSSLNCFQSSCYVERRRIGWMVHPRYICLFVSLVFSRPRYYLYYPRPSICTFLVQKPLRGEVNNCRRHAHGSESRPRLSRTSFST